MLSVEEALARVLSHIAVIHESETVSLKEARGRILAEPVKALLTQPPCDVSAMDGYAVRADEAGEGASLAVQGLSAAGAPFEGKLEQGNALRIFTGASVPEGADSVIMQEDVVLEDGIRLLKAARKGQHIRLKGHDFREGETGLARGHKLDSRSLMLAAAMGYGALSVLRKPRVALLATGDELVKPGEKPGPGQIVASSAAGIEALVEAQGGHVVVSLLVKDESQALHEAFDHVEAAKPDLILTLGGASVGDHDLVRPVLNERGFALDFWTIAMKPGKPLIHGALGSAKVLGLPGNPVSSFICALIFAVPVLKALQGQAVHDPATASVLGCDVAANGNRLDFQRARRTQEGVIPFEVQDSSQLTLLHQADCLLLREPFAPASQKGEPCRILDLHSFS